MNRGSRRGPVLARKKAGHTLVELAAALAVLGILAAMGWWSLQEEVSRYRMMRAARMLQSDLQELKTLAVSTNRQTRLVFLVADSTLDPYDVQVGEWLLQVGDHSAGSSEWDTLPIDEGFADNSRGERSLSPGGADETPGISLATWPTLAGPGVDNADAIVFSPRGWVENPVGDFVNGYIALRIVNKSAARDGRTEEAVVRLSRGGLTRLEVSDTTALPTNAVGAGEASTR
jgi:prepilin-type N-terminal cleavage/methylation domain-containing protein